MEELINTKICVVDDDPSVRRALKLLLNTVGTDVETFASSEEFLNSFSSDELVCLILDVYLGGMGGIELYHHPLAVDADFGSEAFGEPTDFSLPREFRIGVRYTF